MKTEEDEAFDELAKRQGAWGGGFKAKQDMAMHKTQDQNICRHYKQWQHCHICDLESQAAELAGIKAILDEYGLQAIDFVADFKEALAQPAQGPVGYVYSEAGVKHGAIQRDLPNGTPLYAAPLPVQEREALAQPAQEHVAQCVDDGEGGVYYRTVKKHVGLLYADPPQRDWVGLTAQEAAECWTTSAVQIWENFEAKLKEKNNG